MKKLNLNKGDKAYMAVWSYKRKNYVVVECKIKSKRVYKSGRVVYWAIRSVEMNEGVAFDEHGYRNFKDFRESALCFNPSRIFDYKADAEAFCKMITEV